MKDITKDQLADARKQIEKLEEKVSRLKQTKIILPIDGEIIIIGEYWEKKLLPIIEKELSQNAISYRVNN